MSSHFDPMHQFEIGSHVFNFSLFNKVFEISYSTAVMALAAVSVITWLIASSRKLSVSNPSKSQVAVEYIVGVCNNMTASAIGRPLEKKDQFYAKYVFSVFVFLLVCNIFGLVPGGFAPTAQMSVSLMIGITAMLVCLSISVKKHGFKTLKIFVPNGMPTPLVPLIFIIELFSYLSRPVSLAIRLAANMLAGHVMLEVIAFLTISAVPLVAGFPFFFLVMLSMIEFGISILQAYIFSILTAAYIGDAYHH